MRPSLIAMILFLVWTFFGGCYAVELLQTEGAKHSRGAVMSALPVWGKEVGGLRSRIWIDKERFNTDEPIQVHYAIQNVAKQPKTIWHRGFGANNRIDVTVPGGKPAKAMAGADAQTKAFATGRTREKNVPVVLQPGEIDDAYVVYNLRDFFDMKAAGTYTVEYVHQDTQEEKPLKTNELKIIVEAQRK